MPDESMVGVPTTPDDVTPAFLTAALQPSFPGAQVTWCRQERLAGEHGLSGAGLFRVHLDGDDPDLPPSLVLKMAPAHAGSRAQLSAMGFFEREVTFYRTLQDRTPVATPRCYAAALDPATGHAFLLLEDLTLLSNGSSVRGSTTDEVAAVLRSLAAMHAAWWEDATLGDQEWARLPSMLAPSAVAEVFEQSWPRFVSRLSVPVDDRLLATRTWIGRTLHDASTSLFESGPRTLIHNDVQPDNLFFAADPCRPPVFADWQMATYARGVVDAANVIRGGLQREERSRAEARLLREYHEALVRGGVRGYSFTRCEADYELALVLAPARLASAVGMRPDLSAHPGAAWDVLFPRLMPDPGEAGSFGL